MWPILQTCRTDETADHSHPKIPSDSRRHPNQSVRQTILPCKYLRIHFPHMKVHLGEVPDCAMGPGIVLVGNYAETRPRTSSMHCFEHTKFRSHTHTHRPTKPPKWIDGWCSQVSRMSKSPCVTLTWRAVHSTVSVPCTYPAAAEGICPR